jgi:hypothetical protein
MRTDRQQQPLLQRIELEELMMELNVSVFSSNSARNGNTSGIICANDWNEVSPSPSPNHPDVIIQLCTMQELDKSMDHNEIDDEKRQVAEDKGSPVFAFGLPRLTRGEMECVARCKGEDNGDAHDNVSVQVVASKSIVTAESLMDWHCRRIRRSRYVCGHWGHQGARLIGFSRRVECRVSFLDGSLRTAEWSALFVNSLRMAIY